MYSKLEIVERIKEIDKAITLFRMKPSSASVKGISSSYQGKIGDLIKERAFWMDELKKLEAKESGLSALQGPTFEVW